MGLHSTVACFGLVFIGLVACFSRKIWQPWCSASGGSNAEISHNIISKMSQNQYISTMFTVQGMRKFVCDRLTEAAQEILGAFEKRAQEYESELSRQRRLLERVYSEESRLSGTGTGPDIKEEQQDISITNIQQPIASTSLHGDHSESQSLNSKDVQNAGTSEPERSCTSNLETEVRSPAHAPSTTQKTPTKHIKCSHGYRLPKSHVPKQNNANKVNDKSCNAPLEIIEIEDDSPASSDVEVIQEEEEAPAATTQNVKEISGNEKETNNTNKNGNATSEKSKRLQKAMSGKKSSPPQPHSPELDNNHDDVALDMECDITADTGDNTENETTTPDMHAESLDISSQCSNPLYDEENITLPHDVNQNEELICEDSTGDKTDEKGKSKDEKSGKELHKNDSRMSHKSPERTKHYKDVTDSTSSTMASNQGQIDAASEISNEKRFEENIGISSVNQVCSLERKGPKQPDPKPSHKSPFECDQCGKVSSNFKNYKAHIRSHTAEKKFSCETCDKMFREKGDLKKHRMIHTGEKPFKCPDCGKGFNRRFNMVLHRRVHTGERPYTCETCDKTFTTQVNLRKHERTHTGEKPYTCERCQKDFADSSTFRNHKRIHTGERPYKCCWCKKRFATRTTLKRHSRVHTGERPYECSVCRKTFITSTDMKTHSRIHTGERPYKCDQCGQEFSWWTNYNRHSKTHKLKSTEPLVK